MPTAKRSRTDRSRTEHRLDQSSTADVKTERGSKHRRKSLFAIRMDAADIDRLREVAEKRGVSTSELVRAWVKQRLDAAEHPVGARGSAEEALALFETVQVDIARARGALLEALIEGRPAYGT